ncbi:anti-sigma factor family protein [Pontixanthobacter sp.]|uniref:anti-sigma factor family protein n=1 Tax=Pontixanthobacter sp. TaxID=2792078 RepID=UPI003C7E959A
MTITPEELAAFADGELAGAREAEIAAMIEADPQLAANIAAHNALKQQLGAHFAPILEQPLPDRLTAPLRKDDNVADFQPAKTPHAPMAANDDSVPLKRWGWIAGPALAASLAVAIFLPRGGDGAEGYANAQLAAALNSQLVADQGSDADTRILLSFRNESGEFCRAFSGSDASGIACRDPSGWQLRHSGSAGEQRSTEFRQAGNALTDLMAAAQNMAVGPALDETEEAAAKKNGWQ